MKNFKIFKQFEPETPLEFVIVRNRYAPMYRRWFESVKLDVSTINFSDIRRGFLTLGEMIKTDLEAVPSVCVDEKEFADKILKGADTHTRTEFNIILRTVIEELLVSCRESTQLVYFTTEKHYALCHYTHKIYGKTPLHANKH